MVTLQDLNTVAAGFLFAVTPDNINTAVAFIGQLKARRFFLFYFGFQFFRNLFLFHKFIFQIAYFAAVRFFNAAANAACKERDHSNYRGKR